MVDLVGIEPTTSSMPWKRAPSCATGPLAGTPLSLFRRETLFILADLAALVNAHRTRHVAMRKAVGEIGTIQKPHFFPQPFLS
jgi:hypothetical protein